MRDESQGKYNIVIMWNKSQGKCKMMIVWDETLWNPIIYSYDGI